MAPGHGRQAPVSTQMDEILQGQSHSVDCQQLSLPWNRGGFIHLQGTDRHCISVFHPDFQSSSQNCYFNERGKKSIVLNSLRGGWDQEAEAGLVTTLPCFISLSWTAKLQAWSKMRPNQYSNAEIPLQTEHPWVPGQTLLRFPDSLEPIVLAIPNLNGWDFYHPRNPFQQNLCLLFFY